MIVCGWSQWWSLLTVLILYCLNLSLFGSRTWLLLRSMYISHSLNNYLGLLCITFVSVLFRRWSPVIDFSQSTHDGEYISAFSKINWVLFSMTRIVFLGWCNVWMKWRFIFFDWNVHQLADAILWSLRNQQCCSALFSIWTVNDK